MVLDCLADCFVPVLLRLRAGRGPRGRPICVYAGWLAAAGATDGARPVDAAALPRMLGALVLLVVVTIALPSTTLEAPATAAFALSAAVLLAAAGARGAQRAAQPRGAATRAAAAAGGAAPASLWASARASSSAVFSAPCVVGGHEDGRVLDLAARWPCSS